MEAYREEFIVLADVNHDSALVAWGAFFFERDKNGRIDGKPIDDDDLKRKVSPGRTRSVSVVDNMYLEPRLLTMRTPSVLEDRALMYVVDYGADLRLVAIDSSYEDESKTRRSYHIDPQFIGRALDVPPRTKWLIPFFHHPPFCGGPFHASDSDVQKDLVPAFDFAQVQLVLTGHEHNAQLWRRNQCAYVVTGAAAHPGVPGG